MDRNFAQAAQAALHAITRLTEVIRSAGIKPRWVAHPDQAPKPPVPVKRSKPRRRR